MAWQLELEGAAQADTRNVAEAQRAFMAGVYRWMFLALAVTGGTAIYTVSNPALLGFALRNYLFLTLGSLGLVMVLSFLAHKVSGAVAAAMFVGYSVLLGMTLSTIFLVYQLGSIGQAFFVTGGVFAAMSVYGTVTKKDLTSWSSFLFMGLIGVVIAGVVNIFMRSDFMGFVIACASVVVFTGLTAYDTQKLRAMHAASGYSSAMSLSIVGALTLYLDFVNLFLALLRLFGRRR
ncbi:MAG: Bax inhibitor-1/YccA family protein [Myxococcales bacterium]